MSRRTNAQSFTQKQLEEAVARAVRDRDAVWKDRIRQLRKEVRGLHAAIDQKIASLSFNAPDQPPATMPNGEEPFYFQPPTSAASVGSDGPPQRSARTSRRTK